MGAVKGMPVAVVGAAGRFPAARDLSAYWQLLLRGGTICAEPDRTRDGLWMAMEDPELRRRITTLRAGYLDDVWNFDAEYFNISAREAERIDPQQRLLLETVRNALEDAAITRAELRQLNVGVFVGAGSNDYMTLESAHKRSIGRFYGLGNSHNLLAGRISYYYDLNGPSAAFDTACSSSLTALHFALQSLEAGIIDAAIVGGVNVILSADLTLAFSDAKMLSPSGRCRAFRAGADGYGRGEAVGAVVLRPLADAEAHGHNVRCVVRASAVNQDGRSNGITAPNGRRQVQVIRNAMSRAGVSPSDYAYVEAHGTGTQLGDAIEFHALDEVFSPASDGSCFLGSAKASIGHAEAAAGICGFLKAMLMLEYGTIPPHPGPEPASEILLQGRSALKLSERAHPMDASRRCVGVSSFGFGGSNAHVVLERYDNVAVPHGGADRPSLIVLSSHFAAGLETDAHLLGDTLERSPHSVAHVANTLALHRDHFRYRRAWVIGSRADALVALRGAARGMEGEEHKTEKPRIAFVFSGQGSQYAAMGRALFGRFTAFRRVFEECDALIQRHAGRSMVDQLYGPVPADDDALLDDTHLAQLALFALEYSLAQFWVHAGVIPTVLIGHSIGELVAHAVAGRLALADAVALVSERGRLMQATSHDGAMLAARTTREEGERLISESMGGVCIAAVNGKNSIVFSGTRTAIAHLTALLASRKIQTRPLSSRHAFHSTAFAAAALALREFASFIRPAEGLPVVSNLHGALIATEDLHSDYWGRQLESTVLFAEGVETAIEAGADLFLEIGPDQTLSSTIAREHGPRVRVVTSLRRQAEADRALLEAAGRMYAAGVQLDFQPIVGDDAWRRAALPSRCLNSRAYRPSHGNECDPTEPHRASTGEERPAIVPKLSNVLMRPIIDQQLTVMRAQLALLEQGRPPR